MKKTTDNNLIDFAKERNKHIHEIHEKNLQKTHLAFEKAFPLVTNKKRAKKKKKK